MTRELTNELEERRVIRLLAGAAEAIPPLDDGDVASLLRAAEAGPLAHHARRRLGPRPPHVLSAAAVAAAAALAVMLPLRAQEPQQRSSARPAGAEALVVFPEGSALSLLLSRRGERRA